MKTSAKYSGLVVGP